MKNLLLACMVMLGLQFCFPMVVRAGDLTHVAELAGPGTKDAENDAEASSPLDLPVALLLTLVVRQPQDTPCLVRLADDDRERRSLLPVAGLQPSAP